MRLKLTILGLTLLIFSSMNIYSRALRHISIKDVKQKHQEKIVEKIQEEMRKKEERQYIQSVMETKKYDWRKELNEGMTSSGTFFTTLPATGDVNLAFPSWNVFGGQEFSVSGTNLTITTSGVQEDEIAGTNGTIARFDTSFSNTIIFNVSISGNAVLGVFDIQSNLLLLAQSSGTYSINVPQSSELQLLFGSPSNTIGTVNINNTRLRRTIPLNVFVPLDSPEATSFIRTDSIMSNLSPTERLQKLKELLASGDEYVGKILGADFPGTGAVPPGDYDPFKQAPAGKAGDTPGVEISQVYPADYDMERNIDSMLLKGLQRGDYGTGPNIDKQIQNLQKNIQQKTPGGLPKAQVNQDTQIAASYPVDKTPNWMKQIEADYERNKGKPINPGSGTPRPGRGMGDTWEGPVRGA
jgi:hypothetical protein